MGGKTNQQKFQTKIIFGQTYLHCDRKVTVIGQGNNADMYWIADNETGNLDIVHAAKLSGRSNYSLFPTNKGTDPLVQLKGNGVTFEVKLFVPSWKDFRDLPDEERILHVYQKNPLIVAAGVRALNGLEFTMVTGDGMKCLFPEIEM